MARPSSKRSKAFTPEWRESFKRQLLERLFVRFHMGLILGATTLSGVVVNRGLFWVGVQGLSVRYPVAVACSYGVFFLSVRLWLSHALADLEPALRPPPLRLGLGLEDAGDVLEGTGDLADVGDELLDIPLVMSVPSPSSSSGGSSGGSIGDIDGEGAVIVALVLLVAAIFGSSIYLVWEAPVILTEAALQAVLAAALRRATRRMDHPDWTGSVFKATWKPFAVVVVMAVLFGQIAERACPPAHTVHQVIEQCHEQVTAAF